MIITTIDDYKFKTYYRLHKPTKRQVLTTKISSTGLIEQIIHFSCETPLRLKMIKEHSEIINNFFK